MCKRKDAQNVTSTKVNGTGPEQLRKTVGQYTGRHDAQVDGNSKPYSLYDSFRRMTDSYDRIRFFKEAHKYMSADEVKSCLKSLWRGGRLNERDFYSNDFLEEMLEMLKTWNPKDTREWMDAGDLKKYQSLPDVVTVFGSYFVFDTDLEESFTWFCSPEDVVNLVYDGQGECSIAGYEASIRKEDILAYFSHDASDCGGGSKVILNPDKLFDIKKHSSLVDICNADMLPENIHAKRMDAVEEERLEWAKYISNDASTLKFVIEDTGEKRAIAFYKNRNKYDCAADIAKQTAGLRWNEEEGAFVAPRKVVEYLEAYSAEVKHVYDELDELYNSGYEEAYLRYIWTVNRRAPEATVKDMQSAVNDTRRFFQERYNTEMARLVGSFRSDLPKNDSGYFEENLYRQNTGEFFIVGEGWSITPGDDAKYVKYIHAVTESHAEWWTAEYLTEHRNG